MSSTTRNSLKLSLLTIFSRILGLVRDHFQAVFFGIGPIAFAWEIAMFLPGLLRNLLVEGGIAQTFIPIYTRSLEESKKQASLAAGVVISVVSIGMTLVMLLVGLASPYILPAMTHQSRDEADFMIRLAWILLLFMPTASLTAILAGVSNAHRHFVIPALSPIIMNVGLLIGFFTLNIEADPEGNARSLAWFFVSTALVQMAIQYVYVWRNRFAPRFSLNIRHPAVMQIFYMMLPAVLSTAIFNVNQLVDVVVASYFIPIEVGAVPALRFAQRLIQLPTGIIGVALSTAILPILSQYIKKGNAGSKEIEVMSAFRFAMFLTVPASLGLFFLGDDIIMLLFYGGQWTEESTLVTWQALRFYLLAIPLYSLNKILISIFFAFKDTKTPLRSMVVSTSCNFVMNISLVHWLAHGGIALSTAITAAIHFLQMMFYLQKKHISLPWEKFRDFLRRSLILWVILGAFLFFVDTYLTELSYHWGSQLMQAFGSTQWPRYRIVPKVFIGTGGGLLLYLTAASVLKNKEMQIFSGFFRKAKGSGYLADMKKQVNSAKQ